MLILSNAAFAQFLFEAGFHFKTQTWVMSESPVFMTTLSQRQFFQPASNRLTLWSSGLGLRAFIECNLYRKTDQSSCGL